MDSFIDNPVIAGLGIQLGLGGVFDSMRSGGSPDPTSGEGNPAPTDQRGTGNPAPVPAASAPQAATTIRPGHSTPNVPEFRNRPYIPRPETGGQLRSGGVSPGGGVQNTPGVMDPATLQSPQVKALLGQYGVQAPTTPPDPNLFIHNPQAFQNHPVMAGLLERGLDSLANARPGQNFFQSFTNSLQGNREAEAQRAAQVNAQTMAPISQAEAIQQLQSKLDAHNTATDNAAYHQGMLNYYNKMADDKQDRYLNVPPRYSKETGQFQSLLPDSKSPTGVSWQIDDSLGRDEEAYQRHQYVTKGIQDIADKKYGGDISKVQPTEALGVVTDLESKLSLAKGAASIHNTDTRNATSTTNTQIRASSKSGGSGKLNDIQKTQLKELDSDDKNADSELGKAQNMSSPIVDENGNLAVSQKARAAYIGRLQQRKQQNDQKRQSLLSGGSSRTAPQHAPAFSPSNPFVHSK